MQRSARRWHQTQQRLTTRDYKHRLSTLTHSWGSFHQRGTPCPAVACGSKIHRACRSSAVYLLRHTTGQNGPRSRSSRWARSPSAVGWCTCCKPRGGGAPSSQAVGWVSTSPRLTMSMAMASTTAVTGLSPLCLSSGSREMRESSLVWVVMTSEQMLESSLVWLIITPEQTW